MMWQSVTLRLYCFNVKNAILPAPPSPTRRQTLAWGGTGLLTVVLGALGWHWGRPQILSLLNARSPQPKGSTAPSSSSPQADQTVAATGPLSRSSFAPYLRNDFQLQVGRSSPVITAKLVEVSPERTQHTHKGAFTGFSLLFEAPRHLNVNEGLFTVSHSMKGSVQIYLSPVGRSDKHTLLQAVISQRV